jgi:oligopeptide/dipeptide ABC transporter ATP-binding protein
MNDRRVLLDAENVDLTLPTENGPARVLDHASLRIREGEVAGLVGESGCGKSTLVKSILGILPAGARVLGGSILFDGQDLLKLDESTLTRDFRSSRIGFVPQDPFQAFNPLFRVGTQILDVMRWHDDHAVRSNRAAQRKRLVELLDRVNLPDPDAALDRYPHEFSGGQLQRLTIACAMICRPDLIVADEPTSALDVTTQQQILLLLKELAAEADLALLLVTHDLGLVAQLCDTVTVMYAGQTIETMPARELATGGQHPYTRMLVDCHPDRAGALKGIPGLVPPLGHLPAGCRFHPRCPERMPPCELTRPPVTQTPPARSVRCYLYGGNAAERS